MMYNVLRLVLCFWFVALNNAIILNRSSNPEYLSVYLANGEIELAKSMSWVKPFVNNITSYSGYLTTDIVYFSNTFFWYFPSEKEPEKSPVILWLQGDPGLSVLWGLFEGHGPYYIDKNYDIKKRSYYWSEDHHVIYMENPIGSGYSFTYNDHGYCTNQYCIADTILTALNQLYAMFPELIKNDLYIASETYGCKFVISLAHLIHRDNENGFSKINLKGISVSSSFCDSVNKANMIDYIHHLGLIDDNMLKNMHNEERKVTHSVEKIYWNEVYYKRSISYPIYKDLKSLYQLISDFSIHYNSYWHLSDNFIDRFAKFHMVLVNGSLRNEIHAGELSDLTSTEKSLNYLKQDYDVPITSLLQILANHYKIMFYNGESDLIEMYPNTANFIENLNWCGSAEFKNSQYQNWNIGNDKAGFIKIASTDLCNGSITHAYVSKAGHYVVKDQPLWVKNLMYNFTHND